jgi:RNA-directed DNA polymerase
VPLVARTARQDKVRELQRTLYRAAKADPGRRFHALYDKLYRSDVLERAWELVRANRGAAGIDRQTIADVEEYGVGSGRSTSDRRRVRRRARSSMSASC